MRDERMGDKMPDTRARKWGDMRPGSSHLSEEWHDMHPSSGHMSEKWIDQEPSKGHMSDRFVDMESGSADLSDKWHEMKQERREDPYTMHPSDGDKPTGFKPMAKERPSAGKVERPNQHTESGSFREI